MPLSKYFYTTQEIKSALEMIGVKPDSTVFTHVSLGRLGFNTAGHSEVVAITELLKAFDEILENQGTLLTPSYTYSLGRGQCYSPIHTPSEVGPFSEFVRKQPGWERSLDPMLAVSGKGPMVPYLFNQLPKSCYGYDSIYDRLCKYNGIIVMIGLGLHWATFRHHSEELAQVPFRRIKKFHGEIMLPDKTISSETWDYFAAPYLPECSPDGVRLAQIMNQEGLVKTCKIGIGTIISISASHYRRKTLEVLKEFPWFTARGPECSQEKVELHMNAN